MTKTGMTLSLQTETPEALKAINRRNVTDEEMWNVFNMGIGMVLIVSPENLTNILSNIPESTMIGELLPKKNHQVIIDGIESN